MNCELRIFVDTNFKVKFMGSNRFNSEIFGWKCLKEILSIPIKRFLEYLEEIIYDMLSYNMEFLQKNHIDYTRLPKHIFFDTKSINIDNDLFIINILFANKYNINIDKCTKSINKYQYKLSPLSEYAPELDIYVLILNDILKNDNIYIHKKYIKFVLQTNDTHSPNVFVELKNINLILDENKDLEKYVENYLIMKSKLYKESILLINKISWSNKLISVSDLLVVEKILKK
ncbi:hypothetical protein ma737 [Moumouvirus australiensis]|uniref:Uncharacterized protein n=1 Tax=Moumouvirus australiensis TaxID=2109587 RepID=A0A2P1EMK4_9VIRU|nr:hypothetical protein QKC55_gp167 [Moumouvirus australiensis]AVL95124.1 hypothetical protein ma737 [Moumouvirus australiensis]